MSAAPVVALFCGSRAWTDRERIRRDLESPSRFLRLQPDFAYPYPLGEPGTAQMVSLAEGACIQVREP